MSIPLDRLYHYIDSIARDVRGDNVLIYHFWPHGSKNIDNLVEVPTTLVGRDYVSTPRIICHDQEPLNFELYQKYPGNLLPQLLDKSGPKENFYQNTILLHSEQHSSQVEWYSQNNFIPVYYWAHAIIAQDWFRYAKHIKQTKNIEHRFLVYNRAWSGTREYRLGFADRLIRSALVDHVMMRVSPIDSSLDKHYDLHYFTDPEWRPENVIEHYFPLCQAESHYSADFDLKDYESTDIEVVLETLFDDQRIHLTEKTLRPIAMGQPFILAGPPNSLKYLQSYGFKTFRECWDESYDMMTDSVDRMNKIIEVMKQITSGPTSIRDQRLEQAREIAVYNRQHFFSKEFQNQVLKELKTNLKTAYSQLTLKN